MYVRHFTLSCTFFFQVFGENIFVWFLKTIRAAVVYDRPKIRKKMSASSTPAIRGLTAPVPGLTQNARTFDDSPPFSTHVQTWGVVRLYCKPDIFKAEDNGDRSIEGLVISCFRKPSILDDQSWCAIFLLSNIHLRIASHSLNFSSWNKHNPFGGKCDRWSLSSARRKTDAAMIGYEKPRGCSCFGFLRSVHYVVLLNIGIFEV